MFRSRNSVAVAFICMHFPWLILMQLVLLIINFMYWNVWVWEAVKGQSIINPTWEKMWGHFFRRGDEDPIFHSWVQVFRSAQYPAFPIVRLKCRFSKQVTFEHLHTYSCVQTETEHLWKFSLIFHSLSRYSAFNFMCHNVW